MTNQIRAEELRIGNYIAVDGYDPQMVALITMFQGTYEIYHNGEFQSWHNSSTLDKLRGIPLSEDWLKRFGFYDNGVFKSMKKYITPSSYGKTTDKTYLVIAFDGESWIEVHSVRGTGTYIELQTHSFDCRYVHQLQNLYFALTGEELELKENL